MDMPYVRTKKVKGQTYYYLVEAKREGMKVRQKVLRYLGKERPSPEEIERLINEIKGISQANASDENHISPYIWYE